MPTAVRSSPSPRHPADRHSHRARHGLLLALLIPPGLLISDSAFAQGFGRWWWTATAGARQRITTVSSTRSPTRESRDTDLGVSGAINGYVIHPSVGDFGADLDLLFRQNHGSRELDTDRVGYGLQVNLLPRGRTPLRLFARRRSYDYSGLVDGDPSLSFRVPDITTRWGMNAGVRRGAFRGLEFEMDRLTSDYEDGTGQTNERQTLDWSRNIGPIQNRLRLRRLARDLGDFGSSYDDLTAGLDQRGDLAATWHWNFSGTGLRREMVTPGSPLVQMDNLRLSTSVSHDMHRNDLLVIRAGMGMLRPGLQTDTKDYRAAVSYRWRPQPAWSFTPFVDYTALSQENHSLRSPRMNMSVTWNPRAGSLDALLSATGSYGIVKSDNEIQTSDSTETGFALAGSVAHGSRGGLRKEFEAQVSRNQLRLSTEPILALPDLGLARNVFGAQDHARARFGLDRSRGSHSTSGWIEWNRRKSSGDAEYVEFESNAYSATLGYSARKAHARGHLGQTDVTNEGSEPQTLRFAGAQVNWRPLRYLDLRASYRRDLRMVRLAPNLDGEQFGAGAMLHIGLFDVSLDFLHLNNQLDEENETSRRSIVWSISRRFAGWLPIVTGHQRAGVIR